MKHLFCKRSALTNEASVEQFFIDRMLKWLGYPDELIALKTSIEALSIGKGSKKAKYKPDYVLQSGSASKKPRWIIDAKSPSENLDDWVEQCASYCLVINRRLPKGDGVRYFMLSNGQETRVYEWESDKPIVIVRFDEFSSENLKTNKVKELLAESIVSSWLPPRAETLSLFEFEKPSRANINSLFSKCNNYIYKRDNISPSAAFHEFAKLMFIKIRADRSLHSKFAEMAHGSPVPAKDVTFSVRWIEQLEGQHPNPMNVQFESLVDQLEKEIHKGSKKRIFNQGEALGLQPDTVKEVVNMLQHFDLFGIDEDLNGRLFETFLNSTMRGRELGQYFTPRSIVKLMTSLAEIRVSKSHVDTVIDPCCGTGGFLIEAMAAMTTAIETNATLTQTDKKRLIKQVKEDSIFGIDVGRDPPVARIARINMYLHGDGGSRIYIAEALDKTLENQGFLAAETEAEVAELREYLNPDAGHGFDVVLTNPPFSKEYDPKTTSNKRILKSYEIGEASRTSQPFRSNILFLERYYDLLKPGGRVLAVVDESILGGKKYDWVRDYIREHFIIRAVISLPGDAFQRSGARVKTSIIYLTKRADSDEVQSDVFMWYCTAIGVDDSARQRVTPEDAVRRDAAQKEVDAVLAAYLAAQRGTRTHLVPSSQIGERLDVKSCVLKPGRKTIAWQKMGLKVGPVRQWAKQRNEPLSVATDDIVRLLSVRYDGHPGEPEECIRETIKYSELFTVRAGDIVVSHINAVNGAICVIPDRLDGACVSSEYTVLCPADNVNAYALWAILRSPEIRADILTRSSGIGRHRIDQALLLDLPIPAPIGTSVNTTSRAFVKALELEAEAERLREEAQRALEATMDLSSKEAQEIILAFKPPR